MDMRRVRIDEWNSLQRERVQFCNKGRNKNYMRQCVHNQWSRMYNAVPLLCCRLIHPVRIHMGTVAPGEWVCSSLPLP